MRVPHKPHTQRMEAVYSTIPGPVYPTQLAATGIWDQQGRAPCILHPT